jgi:hypothetical protein
VERIERRESAPLDVARGRENRLGVVTDLDESARVGDDSLRVSLLAKRFEWVLGNGTSTRRSPRSTEKTARRLSEMGKETNKPP